MCIMGVLDHVLREMVMFYMTVENAYGQRALFRCYSSSAGFTSVFVRYIHDAQCDAD